MMAEDFSHTGVLGFGHWSLGVLLWIVIIVLIVALISAVTKANKS